VTIAPAVFLSHGSPMVALEHDGYDQALRAFGERNRPRAIAVVSAHWTTAAGIAARLGEAGFGRHGAQLDAAPGVGDRPQKIFDGFRHGSLGMRSIEFRAA